MHSNWRTQHALGAAGPASLAQQPLSLTTACSSSRLLSRMHAPRYSSSATTRSSSISSPLRQSWTLHSKQPARTRSIPGPPAAAAPAATELSAAGDDRAARLAAPVVIIGGGPVGLCTALMLARRGYTQIKVFECLPEPPAPDDLSVWGDFEQASERLYMIGLNGRGQAVLRGLDVMDRIDQASSLVLGRLDWTPGTPPDSPKLTRFKNRTYKTRCIQRDRIAGSLLRELQEKHGAAVSVTFGVQCGQAEWRQSSSGGPEVCRLKLRRQQATNSSSSSSSPSSRDPNAAAAEPGAGSSEWIEESSFVIGADGAGSTLRSSMEASSSTAFSVKRFEDKNTIVYRTIPLFWPKEMADTRPGDLNYSIRTKSGINLDCLPTKEGPYIGVMLYKPGDKRIAALKTGEDVRSLFQENFPAFLPAVREVDLERFAAKSDCSLPTFSYAGPVLHHGSSTCLVGDAIHTVKPYFGQGLNSGLEDVQKLECALEQTGDDASLAVQRYTELRAKDAESLVVLSHSLDGGFLTFVGPLILDSMLHRMLPKVFSPNIIASLQNEKWSFSQIRARKRLDRAMQVGLLAGLVLVLVRAVAALLGVASRLLGTVGAV